MIQLVILKLKTKLKTTFPFISYEVMVIWMTCQWQNKSLFTARLWLVLIFSIFFPFNRYHWMLFLCNHYSWHTFFIVDDRIAIIASANFNDRSFLGTRDSELGPFNFISRFSTQLILHSHELTLFCVWRSFGVGRRGGVTIENEWTTVSCNTIRTYVENSSFYRTSRTQLLWSQRCCSCSRSNYRLFFPKRLEKKVRNK